MLLIKTRSLTKPLNSNKLAKNSRASLANYFKHHHKRRLFLGYNRVLSVTLGILLGLFVSGYVIISQSALSNKEQLGIVISSDLTSDEVLIRTADGDEFSYPLSSVTNSVNTGEMVNLVAGQILQIKLSNTKSGRNIQQVEVDSQSNNSLVVSSLMPNDTVSPIFAVSGTSDSSNEIVITIKNARTEELLFSSTLLPTEKDQDRWLFSFGVEISDLAHDLKQDDQLITKLTQAGISLDIPLRFQSQLPITRARAFFVPSGNGGTDSCVATVHQQVEVSSNDPVEGMVQLLAKTKTYQGSQKDVRSFVPNNLLIESVTLVEGALIVNLKESSLPDFSSMCELEGFASQLERSFSSMDQNYSVRVQVADKPRFFQDLKDKLKYGGN